MLAETAVPASGATGTMSRGMKEAEMRHVADLLDRVMTSGGGKGDAKVCTAVRDDVRTLCKKFPLWH